jgi:SAM-dependent methyltransferase
MEPSDSEAYGGTSAEIAKDRCREFAYLCVDEYLADIYKARALATAFETGLIDAIARTEELSLEKWMERNGVKNSGLELLVGMLESNGVIERSNGSISFTDSFSRAMQFRDLMELKAALAHKAAHDFLNLFSDLVYRPGRFFRRAGFFKLFSYDRSLTPSRENYEATRRWMTITTILTKYESAACLKYHDFSRYGKILDIGGNSGEFVLRILKENPKVKAAVFDLPLVCEIGEDHVRHHPEAGRISFIKGNALIDELPGGFDLITFKSMLHDWPEKESIRLIENASRSLKPGGTLLIFERGPVEAGKQGFPYSIMPFLLYSQFFRPPVFYERVLTAMDFTEIAVKEVRLDMKFNIITAVKGN